MNPNDYEIIDAHIHPALTPDQDTSWFNKAGTGQRMVDSLRRIGIRRACGSIISGRISVDSFAAVKKLNDDALSFRDQFPDFYIPGIHVHPRFPDESCRELEIRAGQGVKWVGELVGYMMGYQNDFATQNMTAIFQVAQSLDMTVNFHCEDIAVVESVCRKNPKLKLVLAHPHASRSEFAARLELIVKYDNLRMDISGSGIMRRGMIRKIIDSAGVNKVVFGTDYPICEPTGYVFSVLAEDLTEVERRLVFATNFLELIQ